MEGRICSAKMLELQSLNTMQGNSRKVWTLGVGRPLLSTCSEMIIGRIGCQATSKTCWHKNLTDCVSLGKGRGRNRAKSFLRPWVQKQSLKPWNISRLQNVVSKNRDFPRELVSLSQGASWAGDLRGRGCADGTLTGNPPLHCWQPLGIPGCVTIIT